MPGKRKDLERTENTMDKIKNPVFDYTQSKKELRNRYSSIEEGVDKYVASNNPFSDETDK